ncbi:DUF3883 domain-containing protein [Rhodococcoides corynebacterioides]|uniref:DUF3883 domain-containing protein n=1 Tax=Rhodococcoides corynebacterioides TaxID=53972 RepID=UPI001C9AFD77|nr:DUF3883 domain-containing protein [Rhodococcus corynebacterioides]MBY6363240.1 DUF3883 domain-containing protein [Rhodococcus corynebacterioides]
MLHVVRKALLEEARNSPTMLQDLAGLERYVAESYSARSLIELLQNADDAGAIRVVFEIVDGSLICANDGRVFTESDLAALCRSASSNKRRGQGIGYRGIGFKSIVGVASTVHVLSGNLECSFSRVLTRRALSIDHDVPLVRVPHELSVVEDSVMHRVGSLRTDGFSTVFVMQGLNAAKVRDEFVQFDGDYMLFLNSVRSVVVADQISRMYEAERTSNQGDLTKVVVSSPNGVDRWVLLDGSEVTLAFSADEQGPVPLRPGECMVHAFLPTLEQTGFLIRLNADFSTDPSRTRVVLDERTDELVQSAAGVIAQIIEGMFDQPDQQFASGLLSALTPSIDDVSLQLGRRTLASDLISAVRTRLSSLAERYVLPPTWLNSEDVSRLAPPPGKRLCPVISGMVDGSTERIARFAGVGVLSAADLMAAVDGGRVRLSLEGCADLLSHVSSAVVSTGVTLHDAATGAVEVDGVLVTATDLLRGGSPASERFEQLVASRGTDVIGLKKRLGLMVGTSPDIDSSSVLAGWKTPVPVVEPARPFAGIELGARGEGAHAVNIAVPTSSNSSAWRSAELLVLDLLKELGYKASDHSRQNLGYDILAVGPTNELYVEVKSISHPGQPFALTPNEDSFARDTGLSYVLALAYRAVDVVYIQFIPDGRNALQYVKQCRQWAWECSEYAFQPTHEVRL